MREQLRSSFEKLLDRQPSDREIQNLYRVKAALGIRDNDALWLVLMALESYESLYSTYPRRIADEINKIADSQRALMREAAQAEVARAHGALAESVSNAGMAIASAIADSLRYQSWGWLLLGLTTFGCICMVAGAVLATGHLPGWAPSPSHTRSLPGLLLTTIAHTPAGWIAAAGGGSAGLISSWRLRAEIRNGKRLGVLASSICLLFVSAALLAFAL